MSSSVAGSVESNNIVDKVCGITQTHCGLISYAFNYCSTASLEDVSLQLTDNSLTNSGSLF
jgi:hypothetical protein